MTRVAVTTDRYDAVAPSFVRVDLEPVPLPCIRLQPAPAGRLARARAGISEADLLLVTSPRVVALLWPRGGMPDVESAVVGTSTAAAVIAAGGRVGVVGDAGLARLVDLTADRLGRGRVVIARAEGSDPVALRRLRRQAAHLDEHVVYRMGPVAPRPVPVEAVAFSSPSAVDGWCLSRGLDGVVVGAIGQTTASAVARFRQPDIIAPRPSHSALAEAMASFMEVRS